jgi:hypothetical protein
MFKNIILTSLLFSIGVYSAGAAVIIETAGGSDPADAGFAFTGSGTYSTGSGNDSEAYWYTQSTRAAYYLYTGTPGDFQSTDGWTATYRTKVVPANASNYTDNFFCARDGAYRFDIAVTGGFDAVEAGLYLYLKTGVTKISDVDTTQWHTYQIAYDPDTASASYYVDGDLVGTYAKTSMYTTTLAELRWGDQNSTTTAAYENRYSIVSLETGQNIVPEPASLALLALGGILVRSGKKIF